MKLRHELALVLLLLLISAPTRLLGLDSLPPGLWHDEAYEGIDAVRIVAGARPAFLPENYGREPLYAYAMAGLIAVGGPSVVTVRATSALFGLLTIPAAYFWGRVFFGPAVGLLTAALTAASYWLLQESRLGMRPIALPLFLALASGFVWLAARRARPWAWPLCGLCLGLSLYTYLPARLFPLVITGQALLGLRARRGEKQTAIPGLAVLVAVAALIALPLSLHFRTNPEAASARSSVVSTFASDEGRADPLGTLGRSFLLNLGMFIWRGDDTLRHNLPYRPVFDWLIAPFFLVGLGLGLWRFRRPEYAALWLWLAVMLVPGVLSDGAPHFLRSIGLLPALFALPAIGLFATASSASRTLAEPRAAGRVALLPAGVLVVLLALSQCLTWRDYLLELPRQPGLAETFDAPRAELARVAGDPPPDLDLDLPTPGWSYATIRFLRPHSFSPPAPPQPAQARFGTNVVLLGYGLEPALISPGQPVRLTLYWRALREMGASYVETARVVDDYGRVWWQRDGLPGSGTLPTDTWMPGEFVADRATLELNPDTPPGEYQLEIALAQPDGGRRLSVYDPAGRQLGASVKLPGIEVRGPG